MSGEKVGADDYIQAGGRIDELPRTDPPDPHCTALGNSERLIRQHGADVRYCYAFRSWFEFAATHWKRDPGDGIAERAKLTTRAIYREAAELEDPARRKCLSAWASKTESEHEQHAMIALARSAVVVTPEQLDRHAWLWNSLNGTLDLRSGELRGHRRDDFLTKLCPVPYDPTARCPRFEEFLAKILDGDDVLIAWLQKALGSALVGKVIEQILLIFWGAGANGKTTLLRILLHVFGLAYGQQAPMTTFLAKHGDSIPNDLARLAGARLVVASESGDRRRLDEATVKALTGNDLITARFLNAEFFTFEPTFTVILSTNHRPEIRGTDHAIWRRIRLVPFTVTIPDAQQDRHLLERVLFPEAPGILAWLVQGCRRWQREGLDNVPSAVMAATADYQRDCDVLGPFLEDRCHVKLGDPFIFETSSALYSAYRRYCETTGEVHPISNVEFGRRLGDKGLTKDKNREGTRTWRGIALRGDGG